MESLDKLAYNHPTPFLVAGGAAVALSVGAIVSRWQAARIVGMANLQSMALLGLANAAWQRKTEDAPSMGRTQANTLIRSVPIGVMAGVATALAAQLALPSALRKVTALQLAVPTAAATALSLGLSLLAFSKAEPGDAVNEAVNRILTWTGVSCLMGIPLLTVAARYIPPGTLNLFRG